MKTNKLSVDEQKTLERMLKLADKLSLPPERIKEIEALF